MNVEIRLSGKRKKYYLAHSFREGKNVRKIRRYLGADLTPEHIEALKKRAEELIRQQAKSHRMIRNPLQHELSEKELESFKGLENEIEIKHLSESDWEEFTELFTYNTNAIEGSTVTLGEVKGILEKDKWPAERLKEDISETYGVANAVKVLRETKEHLSLELIKKLHEIVFMNSKQFAGKFRATGVEVVVRDGYGRIAHVGAPSRQITRLLKQLVEWYGKNKSRYSPILLAVVVHNQFEVIHPFQDGNGRVGRLLLNNILLKHKLPPVNIGFDNRAEYYNALQEYQNSGNIRPMAELVIKEYKKLNK